MEEGIAFVVGVSEYTDEKLPDLECTVKDAKDLAAVLRKLDYKVIDCYDDPKEKIDDEWFEFKSLIESEGYETAIVYFSGHGMHVNDSECLLLGAAKYPMSQTDSRAKAQSLILSELMKELDALEVPVKIFIIDACRTMHSCKGVAATHYGLKPSEISRQTFIAYATAIGEPANEGKKGENSVFTAALLNYIQEENLPIEQLFKKVRLHLIERSIDQTPWESSCLISDFAFNHGQLSKYYKAPYSESAFRCAGYEAGSEMERLILSGLRSGSDSGVSGGIGLLRSRFREATPEFKFVAGRMISTLASNGNAEAMSLIGNPSLIGVIDGDGGSNLLKGIFYSLYFDENDNLREEVSGNVEFLNAVERLRSIANDREAEGFVNRYLADDADGYLYRLTPDSAIAVKLSLEETGAEYKGARLMYIEKMEVPSLDISEDISLPQLVADRAALRRQLAAELHVPEQAIRVGIPDNDVYTTFDFDQIGAYLEDRMPDNTNDEVSSLSSNSYIESVDDISPLALKEDSGGYLLTGKCELTVHLEFDHDPQPAMTFPATFAVRLEPGPQGIRISGHAFRPDVSRYYR